MVGTGFPARKPRDPSSPRDRQSRPVPASFLRPTQGLVYLYHAPVPPRRKPTGFLRAGQINPSQLDLPPGRARALLLEHAWRQAAGEVVARQAPAIRITRGILEVRVPDERWAETLTALLPRLAGRLAAAHPELGVRKFRLVREDGPASPSRALPAIEPDDIPRTRSPPVEPSSPPSSDPASPPPSDTEERLRQLMESYVASGERMRGRRIQKP